MSNDSVSDINIQQAIFLFSESACLAASISKLAEVIAAESSACALAMTVDRLGRQVGVMADLGIAVLGEGSPNRLQESIEKWLLHESYGALSDESDTAEAQS